MRDALGIVLLIGVFIASAAARPVSSETGLPLFLLGADISMLPRHEELGAVFRDGGAADDLVRVLMDRGVNSFRVRLFVDPNMRGAVIQDLPYVLALAKRIREADAFFLLDLHYSDTWADPGRQTKPASWAELSFDELVARVESYTEGVLATLLREGCPPDILQVGNEVSRGMLWPEGKLDGSPGDGDRFAALLKAAIHGTRAACAVAGAVPPRILIHYDHGGDAAAAVRFFTELRARSVDCDIVGLSYYPWWHGGLAGLRENLEKTALAFGKPVIIVEATYPWRHYEGKAASRWPETPAGQKTFLEDIIAAVRATPRELGRGLFWWYPESVPVDGLEVWEGGRMALFDGEGKALPALEAFRGGRESK